MVVCAPEPTAPQLIETKILLVALLGVIVAVNPVACQVLPDTEAVVVSILCTTCITHPAGNAALATPVQLVRTPDAGVPKAGVTNVGEVNVTPESTLFVTILEIAIVYPA